MGLISRVKSHKAKLNNEINNDTFKCIKKPGTPEGYRSINVVRRFPIKVVYIMTNIYIVSRTHTRKNEVTVTLSK